MTLTYKDQAALRAWLGITTLPRGNFNMSSNQIGNLAFSLTSMIRNGVTYYPTMASFLSSSINLTKATEQNIDSWVVPIYECTANYQYKAANFKILMKYIGIMSRSTESIIAVKYHDKIYYIGSGLITDNDFNPIMLITVKSDDGPLCQFTVFFSPKVLTEDDKLFIGLRKYVIPWFADFHDFLTYGGQQYQITQVFSLDINKFFSRPEPAVTPDLDKELSHLSKEAVSQVLHEIEQIYQNPT